MTDGRAAKEIPALRPESPKEPVCRDGTEAGRRPVPGQCQAAGKNRRLVYAETWGDDRGADKSGRSLRSAVQSDDRNKAVFGQDGRAGRYLFTKNLNRHLPNPT